MTSIFTRIINKEIPREFLYENENLIVIRDINPKAKIHLLIIPKKEIPSINELEIQDSELLSDMFLIAKKMASDLKISEGYQLHFNVGPKGGQEVMHLHLHLLSDL